MKKINKVSVFGLIILVGFGVFYIFLISIPSEPKLLHLSYITFDWSDRWGIGNEMYTLASSFGIGKSFKKNHILCFNLKVKIRNMFNLSEFPHCTPDYLLNKLNAKTFTETSYAIYDSTIQFLYSFSGSLVLRKFFQSWKYFQSAEVEIRKLFRLNSSLKQRANNYLKKLSQKLDSISKKRQKIVRVGIHVRRKNLGVKDLKKLGYVTPDKHYYDHAILLMEKKLSNQSIIFVVCSDDLTWAKSNLLLNRSNIHFVDNNEYELNFAILSLCDHMIISVGTYGWWAAWLANGLTIYYSDWPKQHSWLQLNTKHQDYFPPYWIPLV